MVKVAQAATEAAQDSLRATPRDSDAWEQRLALAQAAQAESIVMVQVMNTAEANNRAAIASCFAAAMAYEAAKTGIRLPGWEASRKPAAADILKLANTKPDALRAKYGDDVADWYTAMRAKLDMPLLDDETNGDAKLPTEALLPHQETAH